MSLCRFSSMNWRCDLYVYEAVEGYAVHVATSRHEGGIPPLDDLVDADTFMRSYRAQMAALDAADIVPIGGPHDGESFYGLDDDELRDLLTTLQAAGYLFPADLLGTEETQP